MEYKMKNVFGLRWNCRDREAGGVQVSNNDAAVVQRWLEDKQPEEKTNTDCLVKEQEKVHLGIKVGANITVTGVPGQEGAEGNVVGKKKVKESMKANLGKLLKYNAWSIRWSPETPNPYGNLISNTAAGIVGGTGVMPEGNVGTKYAIFEQGWQRLPSADVSDIAYAFDVLYTCDEDTYDVVHSCQPNKYLTDHIKPLFNQITKLEEVLYNNQFEQHWLQAENDRQVHVLVVNMDPNSKRGWREVSRAVSVVECGGRYKCDCYWDFKCERQLKLPGATQDLLQMFLFYSED
ncbi:hypothetical protein Tco_1569365 [Tanacetum coccineum]